MEIRVVLGIKDYLILKCWVDPVWWAAWARRLARIEAVGCFLFFFFLFLGFKKKAETLGDTQARLWAAFVPQTYFVFPGRLSWPICTVSNNWSEWSYKRKLLVGRSAPWCQWWVSSMFWPRVKQQGVAAWLACSVERAHADQRRRRFPCIFHLAAHSVTLTAASALRPRSRCARYLGVGGLFWPHPRSGKISAAPNGSPVSCRTFADPVKPQRSLRMSASTSK